jgi:hypothetical protein
MPRPGLPTPASSTDLTGSDKPHPPPLEMSFTLPPPAMVGNATGSNRSSTSPIKSSDSSYHPASPPPHSPVTSPRNKRRISSTAQTRDDFSLPPPPTRSRKIIHMKPKAQDANKEETRERKQASKVAPNPSAPAAGSKRKQPSSTSVAGRKIARKTAHSLIERRRRSKMNEEFGILKDMIPACTGQEMHKLAILQVSQHPFIDASNQLTLPQASIDYLRYLEQCVADLKTANGTLQHSPSQNHAPIPPILDSVLHVSPPAPFQSPPVSQALQRNSTSPIFSPSAGSPCYNSYAPTISLPSPVVDANQFQRSRSQVFASSTSSSTTTSPTLLPLSSQHQNQSPADSRMDVDMDHEATAALLMLNADRRGARTLSAVGGDNANKVVGKGMSVKDLLST